MAELARDDDNRSVLDIWVELFNYEVDAVFWSDELARATVPLLVKIYVEPVLPIGELVAGAAASGGRRSSVGADNGRAAAGMDCGRRSARRASSCWRRREFACAIASLVWPGPQGSSTPLESG